MNPVWPEYFQPSIVRNGRGHGLSGYVIGLEAWRRGLTVTFDDPTLRRIKVSDSEGKEVYFLSSRPGLKKHPFVHDKYRINQLLRAASVPVPESRLVRPNEVDVKRLVELADELGYPVVLKPLDGSRGRGVFANIGDSERLAQRYQELLDEYPTASFVLERHVSGRDYRVLVYEGTYSAACLRIPANVVGDGTSTVDQLIDAKNKKRLRNPFLSTGLIKRDGEIEEYLGRVGHSFQSVPTLGEHVQLKAAANASAGGDVIDVTNSLPEDVQQAAIDSVMAVPELPCAGVDILYNDTHAGKQQEPGSYHVLELNGVPQIGLNMYPSKGIGVDVPKKIIDLYFPLSSRSPQSGDRQLAIALDPIKKILAHGHASEVIAPRIPPGRFRFRRVYDFASDVTISHSKRTLLLRKARELGVAGFVRRSTDKVRVMVAGSEEQVDEFYHLIAEVFGQNGSMGKRWIGPVVTGLSIDL